MEYRCRDATPMILALSVHYSRASDLVRPDHLVTNPAVPVMAYRDLFGNWCSRLVAPTGRFGLAPTRWSTIPACRMWWPPRRADPGRDLPEETLVYLLGSRYCETDRLFEIAWKLFGAAHGVGTSPGHLRLRPPSHRVRLRARPDYGRPGKPSRKVGVCRDYAHLAVAFCRCMNIPARYCTGYLGDMGTEPPTSRWILPAGSRSTSVTAGTPSMRGTTCRALAGY